MKYLIINADDFGKYEAVNEGIIEGINAGVITSTSLMVYGSFASDVSKIKMINEISIGLHFVQPENEKAVLKEEFLTQVVLFEKLVGRRPDHIDSHKIRLKELAELQETLDEQVKKYKTPLRDSGYANFIDKFFGLSTKDYKTIDKNKISPQALISILDMYLINGYNELMCHAGRVDEEVLNTSTYNSPREVELNTLLSAVFKDYLRNHNEINLISWRKVKV